MRRFAPGMVYEPGERQLPVDFRRAARRRCADAPDDRDLDVHRSDAGRRATVFTRVIRRGGRTYLQYWLYYPDSNSTVRRLGPAVERRRHAAPAGGLPRLPRDDWEGHTVRIDRDGRACVRSPPTATGSGASRPRAATAGARAPAGPASRAAATPATSRSTAAAGRRAGAAGRADALPTASRREPARAHDHRGGPRLVPLETHRQRALPGARSGGQAALAEGGIRGSGNSAFLSQKRAIRRPGG